VPYKRVDMIVDAFTRMNKSLVVIGDGPDRARIERAAGPNVRLPGHQQDEVIAHYLKRARDFALAADEDFGIAPVEAQAAAVPSSPMAKAERWRPSSAGRLLVLRGCSSTPRRWNHW
jgi:glycosyltransferase involved in cell wall biosynthesis